MGLLYRVLVSREGNRVLTGRLQLCCSWCSRSQYQVQHFCTRYTVATLNCGGMCTSAWSIKLKCQVQLFLNRNSGLQCQPDARPLHLGPYEQVKLCLAQREKKVGLYYPDSIFISWELLVRFANDISTLIATVYS